MPDQPSPRKEQLSTYFVQDRSNQEEMARLHIQDQLATSVMGGVLPEQPDPTRFHTLLDVGCGTGDWLIATAKTYPTMTRLVGVDISGKMLDYARRQAATQQVSDRVEFHVMDALSKLEFPDSAFDLVNHRLGMGWIRKWDWPKLLEEYQRVVRIDGVIRVTESDLSESSSPALNQLNQLLLQALYQAGNFFTQSNDGVTSQIAHMLSQYAGIRDVQTRAYTLESRAGTPEAQNGYENAKYLFRTARPFLGRWMRVPEEYDTVYQQMLTELQQPDFVSTWRMLTAWGSKS
ncbi:MAG TPA: class I SAM-dependent methyltransferase [Ktedonosporobacter sp.]|nr:class I SAM-dependent methyltransferase [Ktedonosporobacter sp.]